MLLKKLLLTSLLAFALRGQTTHDVLISWQYAGTNTLGFHIWKASGSCSGALGIQVGGTSTANSATVLNFNPGGGILVTCTYNSGSSRNDCTFSYNSVLIPTHYTIHANENFCGPQGGSSTVYTCTSGGAGIITYNTGMEYLFLPDVTSSGSPTVTIDGLTPVALKKVDCSTAVGTTLTGGQFYKIAYNGSVFCVVN